MTARSFAWPRSLALLSVAGMAWGCTAYLGGTGSEDSEAVASGVLTASETEMRRLGKRELSNSVHALFPALPADYDPAVDVPEDNAVEMAFSLPGTVSEIEVKRFMDLGEELSARLGDGSPGSQYVCTGDPAACARDFLVTFTARAFRRPAATAEVDDLMVLFSKLTQDTDPALVHSFSEALDVLVEAVLQSPGFLYRWERGLEPPQMDGKLVKFDDYEIASRLSFFIWNTLPDEELLAAAAAEELDTPDQIEAQARRMVQDPRMDETLGDFITQWLELKGLPQIIKDSGVYPKFTAGMGQAMWNEAQAFARDVFRGPEPTLTRLLTAETSVVSPELAEFYGLTADEAGRIDFTPTERRGILSQGAFLAAKGNSYRTSPVRRGKFVLNRLLCVKVPPPPPEVVPQLPPPDASLSQREQMAMHREDPSCNNCHGKMDPLGFAFEYFDGAGGYREEEAPGVPVDASGSVELDGERVEFASAIELARALAVSPGVHECFARQWLRYALDRFEQDAEEAVVASVASAHESANLDLNELVVAIVRSLPFTHRKKSDGEVSP